MRRLLLGFLAGIGVASLFRWRPREQHVSSETLDDIARREDTAGLGEINTKDPHPYAVQSMRVLPRAGVDPHFLRGRR